MVGIDCTTDVHNAQIRLAIMQQLLHAGVEMDNLPGLINKMFDVVKGMNSPQVQLASQVEIKAA